MRLNDKLKENFCCQAWKNNACLLCFSKDLTEALLSTASIDQLHYQLLILSAFNTQDKNDCRCNICRDIRGSIMSSAFFFQNV